MSNIEILKLLKNCILLEGSSFNSFESSNKQLYPFALELYFETETKYEEGTFYVIDLYFVRKLKGYIQEKEGVLTISEWDLLEQTFYRTDDQKDPMEIIASSLKEEKAVMIDETKKEYVHYYQEKNGFGIYGQTLETTHYLKIRNPKILKKTL